MRCECYRPADKETGVRARGQLRYGWYWIEGVVYVYSRQAADLICKTHNRFFDFTDLGKAQTSYGRSAWKFGFEYQTNSAHREGNWNCDLQDDFHSIFGNCLYDIAEMEKPKFFPQSCPNVTSGDATGD